MQQIYNSSPFSIYDQFQVLAQNLENKSPELKPASDMDGGCGENKLGDKMFDYVTLYIFPLFETT